MCHASVANLCGHAPALARVGEHRDRDRSAHRPDRLGALIFATPIWMLIVSVLLYVRAAQPTRIGEPATSTT
jgi:hypothetical protein